MIPFAFVSLITCKSIANQLCLQNSCINKTTLPSLLAFHNALNIDHTNSITLSWLSTAKEIWSQNEFNTTNEVSLILILVAIKCVCTTSLKR